MDCIIDIAAARALVADAVLWPRVRDFLWDFAPQVHESWLEDLGCETLDGRREDETVMPHVSRLMSSPRVKCFVLSALGVEPCFHVFPKGDWSRLLLLDGSTLESIVKWLGALTCVGTLRRVTDGKTVRALKAALPGIYPEVFGYTMYFGRDLRDGKDLRDGRDDADHVVQVGFSVLMSFLAPLPEPLVSRFKLKFSKTFSASAVPCEADNPAGNLKSVLAKLLKLKFPEAYRLCC